MDTAAIKNPVIALNGTTAKASTSDATSPDASFDRVLSREVSDRNNANTTTTQQTPDKSTDKTAAKPAEEAPSDETTDKKQTENSDNATPLLVLVAELNATNGSATTSIKSSAQTAESPTDAVSNLQTGTESDSAISTVPPELQNAKQDPTIRGITTQESQGTAQIGTEPTTKAASFSDTMRQTSSSKLAQNAMETNVLKPSAELTPLAQNETATAVTASLNSPTGLKNLGTDTPGTTSIEKLTTNAVIMAPVQLASMNEANVTGSHTEKLAPQVGTTDWNQALGQKVVWMLSNEVQSASLTLNPPDLGPLQVVLNVSNNQASASFVAAQPEVRQALEAALPKLREMLSDAGIQLGQANVSANTQQQHGSYGEPQQAASGFLPVNESSVIPSANASRNTRVVHQGLVDTFA